LTWTFQQVKKKVNKFLLKFIKIKTKNLDKLY